MVVKTAFKISVNRCNTYTYNDFFLYISLHSDGLTIGFDRPLFGSLFQYCPQNVCKLQSSYICGEIANHIKKNEAYSGTKIGNYFRNGLK